MCEIFCVKFCNHTHTHTHTMGKRKRAYDYVDRMKVKSGKKKGYWVGKKPVAFNQNVEGAFIFPVQSKQGMHYIEEHEIRNGETDYSHAGKPRKFRRRVRRGDYVIIDP